MMSSCFLTVRRSNQCILAFLKEQFQQKDKIIDLLIKQLSLQNEYIAT